MAGNQLQVKLEGPFFKKNPGRTVRQNIRDFNDQLAEYGEAKGRAVLDSKRGSIRRWTGHTRNHIKGRTRAEMRRGGKVWAVTTVVSASTDGMSRKDAIRTKAAASGLERRFRVFRTVLYAMRAKLRSIDFTKGLN